MNEVLIVAEHSSGTLSPATAKVVSCAQTVPDAQITLCVFGHNADAAANQATQLNGVAKVLSIDDALHEHSLAALIAPQLAELAAGYSHIFAPSTTFGRDLMPRVAALLRCIQVSEIMAVETAARFRRFIYAGNAVATVEVSTKPVIATVRIASFKPAENSDTPAALEQWQPTASLPQHTRYISTDSDTSGNVDLQSAQRVVSGGRGIGSAENFDLIKDLADLLGAAVGASRAAVDAGFAPNELQVGQTGKIISPDLYIATGISGAIQHLTGIKDAGTIVAINRDSEAPIFEVADIGIVGDLFEILPQLRDRIRAVKT